MTMLDDIRRDREQGTDGPWKWWTSNSWRRLKRDDLGITQSVLCPIVCRDGRPDCDVSETDMHRIARVPQLEAALLAAEELARLLDEAVYILDQHRVTAPVVTEGRNAVAAFRTAMEDTQ